MGRRRKHGIIDNLDPAVKNTVEEMILSAQFTYRDIVEYITDTTGMPRDFARTLRLYTWHKKISGLLPRCAVNIPTSTPLRA